MSRINCMDAASRTTWLLIKEGLLPSQSRQKFQVKKLIPHYLLYAFMINLLIANITSAFRTSDAMFINQMVCVLIPVLNLIAKVVTVQKNKQCFLLLLEDLKSDAFNTHSENQNRHIQIVDKMSKILLKYFVLTTSIFLSVVSLLPIVVNTKILIPNPIKLGRFEIVYQTIHLLSTSYFGVNSACFDLLYVSLIGTCIAQLKILQEKLLNIYENSCEAFVSKGIEIQKEYMTADQILKECVILHEVINRFVEKLSLLLSFPLFVQYICGCFVICNVVLQITIMDEMGAANIITVTTYASVIIFQMAMYHWFGNEITFQSDKIIETCYLSEWYKLDKRSEASLLLLMERAKKPLVLQLYKLVFVSLESLTVVIRWSYSLFALIKARYK